MRKKKPKSHQVAPDPRYGDIVVARFVNMLMWDGKKSIAFKIFYDAMDLVEKKSDGASAHQVFHKALKNVTPEVEVRSRRVGGATFQIPTEIRSDRRSSIAMKWLIKFSRKRSGKGMAFKLASEILAAAKGEGTAVKRKEDMHKMAESNRAFSHFNR